MDSQAAERWVTTSALIVAGIYAYRRLTEPTSTPVTAKQLAGSGPPPPLGTFATAWGFTFLVIAIMAEAAPGLGGAFAILIATADTLTNAQSVLADVTRLEQPQPTGAQVRAGAASSLQTTSQTFAGALGQAGTIKAPTR